SRDRSTACGSRLRRSMYWPAISRRRTGAPVDQTTSTLRSSTLTDCGRRVARRVWMKPLSAATDCWVLVSAIGVLLLLRHRLAEGEPQPLRALAVGRDLGIDLLGVVAALGDRL